MPPFRYNVEAERRRRPQTRTLHPMPDQPDFPLAILAKAPIPGKVKTRLIPALGAQGSADLHRKLVWQTLETAVAGTDRKQVTLWTGLADSGTREHEFFDRCAEHFGIRLRTQPSGDLGWRMHTALSAMAGPGLVIGTDCPVLTPKLLQGCHACLKGVDCVLLPAEDGGYALIGTRSVDALLFTDIDWGTEHVFEQTVSKLHELGWTYRCPAYVWDVDRPADLDRLHALSKAPYDD